ncbi:MAG TPA: L,D-transpeptidase family protein [Sphingopyxis sp.]|nr:L,D-transpeptidase family protein [Sphingopyxis sp.]
MASHIKWARKGAILLGAVLVLPLAAAAEPASPQGSVLEAAERLKPGDYIWAPDIAPHGPLLMIVSLATQRGTLYRNGVPIAITTVSTGKAGHETPTGVFTILQRDVDHRSSLYDDAPMPYMQRLTWGGVALHGGTLPGYPASHGCIRLPQAFARLLYGITRLGMTVIVTDAAAVPRAAPADPLAGTERFPADDVAFWTPERARSGPVSIIVSAADQRILVLRNGTIIGSAPARIEGPITGTSAFVRRSGAEETTSWIEVPIPGAIAAKTPTPFAGRVHIAADMRALLDPLLAAGTSVVVTPDSLHPGSPAPAEILGDDMESAPAR